MIIRYHKYFGGPSVNADERRDFIRSHRTGVFGYGRAEHGPALSVVHYVTDDDDSILVSTTAKRGKGRAVGRSPKVSLCVLGEEWPFTYVQVYADAEIDADPDRSADLMMRIVGLVAGEPLDESLRPVIAQGAADDGRVVLRLHPYSTFFTPPISGEIGEPSPPALPW